MVLSEPNIYHGGFFGEEQGNEGDERLRGIPALELSEPRKPWAVDGPEL